MEEEADQEFAHEVEKARVGEVGIGEKRSEEVVEGESHLGYVVDGELCVGGEHGHCPYISREVFLHVLVSDTRSACGVPNSVRR